MRQLLARLQFGKETAEHVGFACCRFRQGVGPELASTIVASADAAIAEAERLGHGYEARRVYRLHGQDLAGERLRRADLPVHVVERFMPNLRA